MSLAGIVGAATDAAAWTRTITADACSGDTGGSVKTVTCPFVSDSTMYGGRATNIYADIAINSGSVYVSSEACAQTYSGSHFACGAIAVNNYTLGMHDIPIASWGAGWNPYDYFWIQLGYVDGPGMWTVIGTGVTGT